MAWWKTAKSGDPVVCVDASTPRPLVWNPDEAPVEGRIYLFDGVILSGDGNLDLHLRNLKRCALAQTVWGPTVGYGVHRFRPAKTTDLPESLIKCLDVPVSGKRETVS